MEQVLTPALFAAVLTAAGAPIVSAAIWAVIDFLKSSPLKGLVTGHEKAAAFFGAAIAVVLAILIGVAETPPRYDVTSPLAILMLAFAGVLAFYNIGRLAMAVHDDVNRYPNSLRG